MVRVVSGLEVLSVVSSVLLVTWGIVPLLPGKRWVMALPLLLAMTLIIISHRLHEESPAEIGLTFRNFGRAFGLTLLPWTIATVFFIWIGRNGIVQHRLDKLPAELILVPLSGIAQQYFLQGFIYRRIRFMLTGRMVGHATNLNWTALILTASIFGLVHAPNLTLVMLTFTGGIIWSWIYERAQNIYAIGISHGLISLIIVYTMPPSILESLGVGYKYFLYNKF